MKTNIKILIAALSMLTVASCFKYEKEEVKTEPAEVVTQPAPTTSTETTTTTTTDDGTTRQKTTTTY